MNPKKTFIPFLVASVLLFIIWGCATQKPSPSVKSISVTGADLTPPGFNGSNGAPYIPNTNYSYVPYSLTNVIYPTNFSSGQYAYTLSTAYGWGWVTNQPPYSATTVSNLPVQYIGLYGDNAKSNGTVSIPSPAYSVAYRFEVYTNDPLGMANASNYPLTLVGFAMPMELTISNLVVRAYGLNPLYTNGTYVVQESPDLVNWTDYTPIPSNMATCAISYTATNVSGFFRIRSNHL